MTVPIVVLVFPDFVNAVYLYLCLSESLWIYNSIEFFRGIVYLWFNYLYIYLYYLYIFSSICFCLSIYIYTYVLIRISSDQQKQILRYLPGWSTGLRWSIPWANWRLEIRRSSSPIVPWSTGLVLNRNLLEIHWNSGF